MSHLTYIIGRCRYTLPGESGRGRDVRPARGLTWGRVRAGREKLRDEGIDLRSRLPEAQATVRHRTPPYPRLKSLL